MIYNKSQRDKMAGKEKKDEEKVQITFVIASVN